MYSLRDDVRAGRGDASLACSSRDDVCAGRGDVSLACSNPLTITCTLCDFIVKVRCLHICNEIPEHESLVLKHLTLYSKTVPLHLRSSCLRTRLASRISSVNHGTVGHDTMVWVLSGSCLSITRRTSVILRDHTI